MDKMSYMHGFVLTREDVEMILAVAEEGTVTRAANRLHLSQSAVSHHLKALEDRIGGFLFQREPRQMITTTFGQVFVEHGRQVMKAFQRAEEALEASIAGDSQSINVGTECYTSYHWLPALIRTFEKKARNVRVQLAIDATHHVLAALLSGKVDLAIVNSPGEHKDLIYRPLLRDEIVLLTSPLHPLAGKMFVDPNDLASETFLLQSTHNQRSVLMNEFLEPAGIFPVSVQYLQLTEAIIELVKADMGVSALARWMVLPHVQANTVRAIRLGRRGLQRDWRIAFRKSDPRREQFQQLSESFGRHLKAGIAAPKSTDALRAQKLKT